MELALGRLADGTQLVSRENLLERRRAQVEMGEDSVYGMGLQVSTQYGISVVHHGGSMFGFKSDMIFLPDHGVGAAILTNSDSGWYLTGLFRRRLLEVLFDGRPEAIEQARVQNAQRLANRAKWRERLAVPPDAAAVAALAGRYASPALGTLSVRSRDGSTIIDFGTWRSAVATRKNDDGTTSLITVDPAVDGFDFVVGEHEGKRALVIREAQHEYPLIESP
jgi:hypothetical protein